MTKFKLLCFIMLFSLILSMANADAEEMKFSLSLGTLWLYYDVSESKVNADIDLLHIGWLLRNKFIIGLNLVTVHGMSSDDEQNRNTFFPLEAAYIPFTYTINAGHRLSFSVNAKMGWQTTSYENNSQINSNFFGSIGSQLFLQYRSSDNRKHYSRYLSLYADYNIFKELKFGIGVDLAPLVLLIFLLSGD